MTLIAEQTSLFDLPPTPDPDYVLRVVKVPVRPIEPVSAQALDSRLEQHFWTFHTANPDVYRHLVMLARDLVSRGHRKLGMKMLFEVARWRSMLSTTDETSPFKLNNNLTSRYARLIMTNEPDLDGVFDLRELHQ
ncbi:MAG: hypothetical protein V4472_24920 [Pseudomonadota bacterium]